MKCQKIFTVLVLLGIMFMGCSKSDESTGSSVSYTTVSGDITEDFTLAGSPYAITGDAAIPLGTTVTAEPGVVIRFDGFYTFTVEGVLQAVGSPENLVLFSSTAANRVNERGNYRGIVFSNPDQISLLEYCRIEDGALFINGSEEIRGAIHCNGASPVIRKCVLVKNGYNAVYADSGAAPLIDGCTITGNAFSGVSCNNGSKPLIRNSVIVTNDDYGCFAVLNSQAAPRIEYCDIWDNFTTDVFGIDTTGFPGIISLDPEFADPESDYDLLSHSPCIDLGDVDAIVDPDGTRRDIGAYSYDQSNPSEIRNELSGSLTYEYSPYLVTSSIWVSEGDMLTIEPGVVLEYNSLTSLRFSLDIYGTLIAEGTAGNEITITSNKNVPEKGDWDILYFHQGSSASLKYCNILYAKEVLIDQTIAVENSYFYGIQQHVKLTNTSSTFDYCVFQNNGFAGLVCDQYAMPQVTHSVFYQNQGYGIQFMNNSDGVIKNNLFLDNFINGIRCETFSQPEIINNTVTGNAYYGIYCYINSDAVIVNNIISYNGLGGIYCLQSSLPEIAYNDSYGHLDVDVDSILYVDPASMDSSWTVNVDSTWMNYYNCPTGVGELSTVNVNGDSCDFQYNISLNPMIEGVETAPLPASSPGNDAGIDPYPAGSATDIGAFGGADGNWTPPGFYGG